MRDQWLFGYVAALVLIDVVILVLWEIIDPVLVKEHYGRTVVRINTSVSSPLCSIKVCLN